MGIHASHSDIIKRLNRAAGYFSDCRQSKIQIRNSWQRVYSRLTAQFVEIQIKIPPVKTGGIEQSGENLIRFLLLLLILFNYLHNAAEAIIVEFIC